MFIDEANITGYNHRHIKRRDVNTYVQSVMVLCLMYLMCSLSLDPKVILGMSQAKQNSRALWP